MGLLFVRALPSNTPLVVLLKHYEKMALRAFPLKIAFLAPFEFTPLPVVNGVNYAKAQAHARWPFALRGLDTFSSFFLTIQNYPIM